MLTEESCVLWQTWHSRPVPQWCELWGFDFNFSVSFATDSGFPWHQKQFSFAGGFDGFFTLWQNSQVTPFPE